MIICHHPNTKARYLPPYPYKVVRESIVRNACSIQLLGETTAACCHGAMITQSYQEGIRQTPTIFHI